VLIVQYNEDLADILCEIVSGAGLACSIASSTDEALRALRGSAKVPDLILADLTIPGIPVKELLREVRASPALAQVRFGVITAGSKHDVTEPVDAILQMPFTVEKVLESLPSGLEPREPTHPPPTRRQR